MILLAAAVEPLGVAILRQVRYLATLPGTIGSQAQAELPEITVIAAQMEDAAALQKDNPAMNVLDGTSPGYYPSALRYDEVATARAIPQPILLLQGHRDYQVTVANDLDVWLRGLKGRSGVTVVQLPLADHLFLDGTGRPTPLEYATPGHIDPKVAPTIAAWIEGVASRLGLKANSACARTETTYILFRPRSPFCPPHAKVPIPLGFPVSPIRGSLRRVDQKSRFAQNLSLLSCHGDRRVLEHERSERRIDVASPSWR